MNQVAVQFSFPRMVTLLYVYTSAIECTGAGVYVPQSSPSLRASFFKAHSLERHGPGTGRGGTGTGAAGSLMGGNLNYIGWEQSSPPTSPPQRKNAQFNYRKGFPLPIPSVDHEQTVNLNPKKNHTGCDTALRGGGRGWGRGVVAMPSIARQLPGDFLVRCPAKCITPYSTGDNFSGKNDTEGG